MCPNTTLLGAADFAVVWLGVVPSAESRTVHLVALTSKGVRLYFSHSRTRYGAEGPPTCLELLYVRPPPPAGQQGEPSAPGAGPSDYAPTVPSFAGVQHALYGSGTLLAAAPYAPDAAGATDVVLGVARPASSTRLSMPGAITTTGNVGMGMNSNAAVGPEADSATCVLVRGATWDIAEVPRHSPAPAPATGRISPLALQVITHPRVFLVLTSSGLVILTELRPLDTLRSLLETGNVFDQSVHEFFNRYGQAQSCAMALAIASRNSQLLVAPESCLASDSDAAARSTAPRVLSPEAVSHAWRIFFDYGGHPRYDPPPYPSQPPSDGKVTLSGRYHGLTIYLARLIRPFWAQLITRKVTLPGEGERQQPNVAASLLAAAQQDLRSLDEFLTRNAQLFGMGSGSKGRSSSTAPEGEQVAFRAEQTDFDAVRSLLSRTLEAISFILLLIDYQMPRLVARCKPELQTQLAKLTFSDLITTSAGAETARGLVEAIIDSQIAMQVSIDAVADVLQERCGSFCNADDVRLYKALECIRRAKEARDDASRTAALNESAKLLARATKTLPFDKLERICQDYRELQFDLGAIELPLRCAAEWDPHGVARTFRADGMPDTDAMRKPIYEMSLRCYRLVIDTLASLDPKPAGSGSGSVSAQQQAGE
jgi:nuclear pore complex protein Nup155